MKKIIGCIVLCGHPCPGLGRRGHCGGQVPEQTDHLQHLFQSRRRVGHHRPVPGSGPEEGARRGCLHQLQDRRRRGPLLGGTGPDQARRLYDCRSQPAPYRPPAHGDGQCRVQDPGPQADLYVREHPERPARPQRQPLQDPQGLRRGRQEAAARRLHGRRQRHARRRTIWGPRCSTRPPASS